MYSNTASRDASESGYTLQTLIIIAILVLGATTASVILYAVLRDSTSRIAGGSETFDGYPSGPQNLRVESVPSGSNVVDVTVSWEAPSYLGEFPLRGYELSVTEDNSPKLGPNDWTCGGTSGVSILETQNPDFTYGNSCEGTVMMVDENADYELVFTVNLGSSAGGTSSPGGLTFYRELDLSTETAPPSQVQTVSLPDAVAVSWDAVPDVAYRLFIEIGGTPATDYYQCFNSNGGKITREIPNIRNISGYQGEVIPQEGMGYTVKLSASKLNPPNPMTKIYCEDTGDTNFGRPVEFTITFGVPSTPEITFETDFTRTAGSETLPSLKATLAACDTSYSTTFYWEFKGQPETQNSHTIAGCGTPSCNSDCALTIYEDFTLDTEYEVWAVVENDVGSSNPSVRQRWMPTRTADVPGPPQNISAVSGGNGITISWEAPDFIPDSGIGSYILRSEKKTLTTCSATFSNNDNPTVSKEFPTDTLQYTYPRTPQNNYETTCFQLLLSDSDLDRIESSRVDFEAVYINPLTIGTNELLLNWNPTPRAAYYTINWAPLREDKVCSTPDDITVASLQPDNFLSKVIPYNGEATLTFTIPVIRDVYYLVRSTATLQNGAATSWTSYACANLYNAPTVAAPTWTGTTTAGTSIGIQWTKPDLNATDYDNRYGPYSYALRIDQPGGTSVDRCIAFDSNLLTDTSTHKEYQITSSSVAGEYRYSLTAVPSRDCSSASDATSVIDLPPAATPPIRTGSQPVS